MGQDVVAARLDDPSRPRLQHRRAGLGLRVSGGVDAQALYLLRFFGAARNIENGGSLTIIASGWWRPVRRWMR